MTVKWALVKTSPFQGLSEDEKHDILSRMLCVHYDPGERLELGREPGGWWVVEKGMMKVYSIAPDGSALTYAILSAGDSFGETTILTGHWVRATVEALEPTEVRYLSADQFETLLREHPDFALALLRNLAERIRQSEERVFHISRLKLWQRVAHALIGLAQTIGEQTDAGIEIHLTHQEIADYVGASREAVSRTLGRWVRKGWIATNRKSVIIKDLRPFQIITNQMHTAA